MVGLREAYVLLFYCVVHSFSFYPCSLFLPLNCSKMHIHDVLLGSTALALKSDPGCIFLHDTDPTMVICVSMYKLDFIVMINWVLFLFSIDVLTTSLAFNRSQYRGTYLFNSLLHQTNHLPADRASEA